MTASSTVTVIVPTHDHATTIEYSIRSVLEQTVPDLAVVVIGDGVGDDTRDVVHSIRAEDSRVSFLDRPKAPRHGEILRHEVLQSAISPFVAYHGDDDLLLPTHLETMIALLADADFAHPLPIQVEASGDLVHLPTDLSLEECRAWHVASPPRNAVSLTGVAHTLESYRRLPHGWRTTPPGRWTDHYMWQQFLGIPDLTAVTSRRATTVKLAAAQRTSMNPQERGDEVGAWWDRIHQPGFSDEWDRQVDDAVRTAATRATLIASAREDHIATLERQLGSMAHEIERLADDVAHLEADNRDLHRLNAAEANRADAAERTIDELVRSRSWRLTAPLRAVRRPGR